MKCSKCRNEMTLLLYSSVCDYCNPPKFATEQLNTWAQTHRREETFGNFFVTNLDYSIDGGAPSLTVDGHESFSGFTPQVWFSLNAKMMGIHVLDCDGNNIELSGTITEIKREIWNEKTITNGCIALLIDNGLPPTTGSLSLIRLAVTWLFKYCAGWKA